MTNIEKRIKAIENRVIAEIGNYSFEREVEEFKNWTAKELFDYLVKNEFTEGFRDSQKCLDMMETLSVKSMKLYQKLINTCSIY